jgi:hypothetical protein
MDERVLWVRKRSATDQRKRDAALRCPSHLGPFYLVDTEKQPDEARNGACVAIRDQDIAG